MSKQNFKLRFSLKTWSRLKNYLPGPKKSDSSSKTTHIVLFPGLNSSIQVKIPQFLFFLKKIGFHKTGFWLFPGVLEGLGSSGRLIGTISTYPGTYKCPWSRVLAKKPSGGFFSRVRYLGQNYMLTICLIRCLQDID